MSKATKKRRAKGSGSIVKQSTGTYVFRYRLPDGKTRQESLSTKNRREAGERAEELEKALAARNSAEAVVQIAVNRQLIDRNPLPLASVWSEFEKTGHQAAPGTLRNYQTALDRFLVWMKANRPNERDFSAIEPETARAYLDDLWNSGLSPSTFNQHLTALGLIGRKLAARRKGMVSPWPEGKEARKDGKQQERLPLDRAAVQRLLEGLGACSGTYAKETPVAVLLGLFAGLRLVDAVLLDWAAVDLRGGWITYTPRKTENTSGAVCRVPILPPLAVALAALPRDGDKVLPLLAECYGRGRGKDYVSRLLGGLVVDAAGEERNAGEVQCQRVRRVFGFHSLRHTFVTEAARAGVPAGQLKAMSGDNLSTLDRFYARAKTLSGVPAVEFQPLPRLLSSGAGGSPPERDELHRLTDELSLSDVRELLALGRRLGGRGLPAAVDALDVEAEA
jgi:integrase